MRAPVRVVYFTGSLGTGGSEAHLTRLLCGLDRGVVEPTVVLLKAAHGSHLLARVREAGVPVIDLDMRLGKLGIPAAFARASKELRRLAPDVIHTYGWPCDVYAPLIATLGLERSMVITTRRGNQPHTRRHLMYRATNPLVDHVLCVSVSAQRYARDTEGLDPARSSVIPNGVDVTLFRPPDRPAENLVRIGTHSRVAHEKGIDLLLEAFDTLAEPRPILDIAGPVAGTWAQELRARYEHRPAVRFLGEIADAPEFLRSLDAFVLPSRSEGMSMALLEAMATALPIVATDVGSNAELLAGGEFGVLVPPRSGEIALAFGRILRDPEHARALGQAARRRVETEYSLEAMLRRYEHFYRTLRVRNGRGG